MGYRNRSGNGFGSMAMDPRVSNLVKSCVPKKLMNRAKTRCGEKIGLEIYTTLGSFKAWLG